MIILYKFLDASVDQSLPLSNKPTSDLLSLAHLSSSQTPITSSISIPTVSQVNISFYIFF